MFEKNTRRPLSYRRNRYNMETFDNYTSGPLSWPDTVTILDRSINFSVAMQTEFKSPILKFNFITFNSWNVR